MYNPFSLEGKTILVTGASSGIGRATAIECSKMGATVVITGRNAGCLQEAFDELEGEGHVQIVADITSQDELAGLVERVPELDGCVNNAGVQKYMIMPFIKGSDLIDMLRINTIAPILLTNLLVKKKRMKKCSSIVFVSSLAGNFKSSPGNGMYATSKAGLSGFMRNAAIDLAPKGIRCNAVNPGMIVTPIMTANPSVTKEQWEQNKAQYPLKRFGQPVDVAYGIIYLLSDAAAWITGTSLIIDGGRTL